MINFSGWPSATQRNLMAASVGYRAGQFCDFGGRSTADFGNVPFAPGNEKTELMFIFELRVRQRAFEVGFETDDVLQVSQLGLPCLSSTTRQFNEAYFSARLR